MTYEEKLQWFWRYQRALRKEKLLQEELAAQKKRALGCAAAMDGMPRGVSDGQSLPRMVESIVKAEQELACQINVCGGIRREVVAAIGRLPDERDQELLRRRFILGQRWGEISDRLPMSERHVRRCVRRAVERIEIDT